MLGMDWIKTDFKIFGGFLKQRITISVVVGKPLMNLNLEPYGFEFGGLTVDCLELLVRG